MKLLENFIIPGYYDEETFLERVESIENDMQD